METKPARPFEPQFERDQAFLIEHLESWTEEYQSGWVAVYKEQLVARASDKTELFAQIDEINHPRTLVAFAKLPSKAV